MAAPTAAEIMQQATRQPSTQAAGIEQSRAIAEVQASLVVAQQRPRDETKALSKALESCRTWEVAESAFWKFPRAGEVLTGESIHLAVELARCWGNIAYGIMELDRDDNGGKSEMLAFAWDLETNAQSRMTFQVPHLRDTRSGPKRLTDMRDIYENNANQGARRLRECIFRVLPPFLKEQAKAACYKTLESKDSEKPLAVRITEALAGFARLGIGRERIEAKLGPADKLTPADLAQLEVSFRSIMRKEIGADEEFPKVGHLEAAKDIKRVADNQKQATDESEQGRAEEQTGEIVTLASAKAEIDRCELVADVNSRALALSQHLDDDEASYLREYAAERAEKLKGGAK
jgi:hypothetical protein